jgi:maleylpyruvate isomerase
MSIDLSGLETSATALIRTVDALGADELAAPSLLPGWTRAHVVAHLALNGTALAGVLDRLLAATTKFVEAAEAMDDKAWTGTFSRTPGTAPVPASDIPKMRRREIEIHHADLGAVYAQQDWPPDFVAELLDVVCVDQGATGPFTAHAADLDRSWEVGGPGGPTVTGSGADLGWWLCGRGEGGGLSSDAGALPRLGPWRRASATAGPTPER